LKPVLDKFKFSVVPGEGSEYPEPVAPGKAFCLDPVEQEDSDEEEESRSKRDCRERALWERIVRERLGLPNDPPHWFDRPAVARLTISSH